MGSRSLSFYNIDRSVVVTFSALWMVKMAFDQIIGVVAMWNRFVPTSRGVLVLAGMASAIVVGLDGRRMLRVDCDHVLIDMILMSVMQVSIMKVVGMSFMLDRSVPTIRTVPMRVFFVNTA